MDGEYLPIVLVVFGCIALVVFMVADAAADNAELEKEKIKVDYMDCGEMLKAALDTSEPVHIYAAEQYLLQGCLK
jgi:hypothetical protein